MALKKEGSKAIPRTRSRFGWVSGELDWHAATEDEKLAMEVAAADPDARPWSGREREAFLRTVPNHARGNSRRSSDRAHEGRRGG